ncbi:DUF6247 family protein [Streptomyces candidus]|uniref:Uncharacterized protein n=1 Tax=Streptomyces candidus TaxID=67283 RepID=A0A7X0HD16_9ACTN|nr:DUF6247 family protein [Streptomyces candidus]MBB6433943.1 hypothetical protein [Streptomyces candidus]GHH33938.1 hypothetical protein GCM10018773_05300 [Streptomyces candidus]
MSTQPVGTDGPLIPMPAATREALREAVRHPRPLNLTQFDRELGEAFDQAVQTGSIGWMRNFLLKWATFVAVERHPGRAAALREAERISTDPASGDEAANAARLEIARILHLAEQDVSW